MSPKHDRTSQKLASNTSHVIIIVITILVNISRLLSGVLVAESLAESTRLFELSDLLLTNETGGRRDHVKRALTRGQNSLSIAAAAAVRNGPKNRGKQGQVSDRTSQDGVGFSETNLKRFLKNVCNKEQSLRN